MTDDSILGYYKKSDFVVESYQDVDKRREDSQMYNLSFFKTKLIKGVLSTEGNLASIDDIELLTTGRFKKLEFSTRLTERDIQEVWAMNRAFRFMEENLDKPITLDIIKEYNKLIVVGAKSKYSGSLRQTNVYINGTTYTPPDFQMLDRLVDNMMEEINLISGDINKSFSYVLAISKLQVFIDGNKRTALLTGLHHLLHNGQPFLMFFDDYSEDYLKGLKIFYETGDNKMVSENLYRQLDINRK